MWGHRQRVRCKNSAERLRLRLALSAGDSDGLSFRSTPPQADCQVASVKALARLFTAILLSAAIQSAESQTTLPELAARVEAIEATADPSTTATVDISALTPTERFGVVTGKQNDEGEWVSITNKVSYANGGHLTTSYYLDSDGSLAGRREQQQVPAGGGAMEYNEELQLFADGEWVGSVGKRGTFRGALDDASLNAFTVAAEEVESYYSRELYESSMQQARVLRGLLTGLASRPALVLPGSILPGTISPNGRYVVAWQPLASDDAYANFSLFDLEKETVAERLPRGRTPGGNHVSNAGFWSPAGNWFIFLYDMKWNTVEAPVLAVDPDTETVLPVGGMLEPAEAYAMQELQAMEHPFAEKNESISGFLQVISVLDDGRVHLILDHQSKSTEPWANVRCEMTLKFSLEAPVEAAGFQSLDPESPVGEPAHFDAAGELVEELTIETSRVGPITADTPFQLEVIRLLLPDFEVTSGTEFFEEGGEKPVILVKRQNETFLMLEPGPDSKRIDRVLIWQPGAMTESSIEVGQPFGQIFEQTPEGAVFEGMTGDVIVHAPEAKNITLRFEPPSRDGEQVQGLPDGPTLAQWRLTSIEWAPASSR